MGTAIIIPKISFADSDMGKVTISTERPLEGLAIYGPDSVYDETDQAQYYIKYFPAGTSERGVVWSIESGSEYASINASTGVLTVLTGADEDTVVIKATSSENSSIFTYKEVTVTNYVPHTIVPLSYIAAADGRYISTGVTPTANSVITCDFKLPTFTYTASTERQMAYSDSGNVSCGYNKAFNIFAINYVGASATYKLTSFNARGVVTSSANGSTLYNKETSSSVNLSTTGGTVTGTFAELRLYNENKDRQYRKVMIFGFSVSENNSELINLSPVLYDGEPCFYDSVSNSFLHFLGSTGNIWYATVEDPNTEIQYV